LDQFAKSAKKQDGFTLAVKQQLGAWGVGASYTWLGKEKNGAEGDGKAKQWVLAATYDLSKRTQVQAYATKLSNNKSANRNFGINPLNGTLSAAGADPQAIGVGIRHAF
jgi:predicted porin